MTNERVEETIDIRWVSFGIIRRCKSATLRSVRAAVYNTWTTCEKKKKYNIRYHMVTCVKVGKNNSTHREISILLDHSIESIYISNLKVLQASSNIMCLAPDDFNVEISGLVDNEIHHLTSLPGWGARARKRKVFLFPKWSRRSAHRSSILATSRVECQTQRIKLKFDFSERKIPRRSTCLIIHAVNVILDNDRHIVALEMN